MTHRAILLMGATATGKTDLAVRLAERFNVELISVDSALIYRDMNIGTAKPGPEILSQAPHHLIDIIDPSEAWSAWNFVSSARKLIEDINQRGKIPLLVGGTMMYFHALEQGMNQLPQSDPEVRKNLLQVLDDQGLETLFQRLQVVDPGMAARLNPTDRQRILRALEVFELSGQPMSVLQAVPTEAPDIEFQRVILDVPDRSMLHQRIEKRFRNMLELGFEKEVISLRERGDLNLELPSMRCVGYRQMWMYLDGDLKFEEMIHKSVVSTRQLAKRQLTWLRKYQNVIRIPFLSYKDSQITDYLDL